LLSRKPFAIVGRGLGVWTCFGLVLDLFFTGPRPMISIGYGGSAWESNPYMDAQPPEIVLKLDTVFFVWTCFGLTFLFREALQPPFLDAPSQPLNTK